MNETKQIEQIFYNQIVATTKKIIQKEVFKLEDYINIVY